MSLILAVWLLNWYMLSMYVYVHLLVVPCFFQKALYLASFSETYLDAVWLSVSSQSLPLCVSGERLDANMPSPC